MIVPIGSFTPELSRQVRETASHSACQHDVVISMYSTRHFSWRALCEFADWLHSRGTSKRVLLADAVPTTRTLLRELGIDTSWYVPSRVRPAARITVSETALDERISR